MTSRAEKMRHKLGNIAKDRQEFELQKKALEAQMNSGKKTFDGIKKGLQNHVIVGSTEEGSRRWSG